MFRNFLILAFRNFKRSPLTSFIELFGMTVAITVFLLILLWVFNETSFDNFNENSGQIYRLESSKPNEDKSALITSIVAPILKENVPGIKQIARLRSLGPVSSVSITNDQGEQVRFSAGPLIYIDNSAFEIFPFEFIEGNPKTALTDKYSIVITESLAKTVFGTESAMGKTLDYRRIVTGVIKDVPNFHMPFKTLRAFPWLEGLYLRADLGGLDIWGFPYHPTYLLINTKQNITQLEKKITQVINSHRPEKFKERNSNITYHLRPIKDIYFNGGDATEMGYAYHGDKTKLVVYSSIAIFMLLLACINFINLNSAKSLERAREVGIKKVVGASRLSLFLQFLGEVIIMCNIALVLALICTNIFLPKFNDLMDTTLMLNQLFKPSTFVAMIFGLLLISLVAGGFPALYMSSFKPVRVMKGLPSRNTKGITFRKINLAIQFTVTMVLIVGSITVLRQINYMKNVDLGFDKDHIVAFPFNRELFGDKSDVMKRSLLANPNVKSVSYTHAVPGRNFIADQEASTLSHKGIEHKLTFAFVDEDYQKTLELEIAEGRWFEKGRSNDYASITSNQNSASIVLNQMAVKFLGLEQPLGVVLKTPEGREGIVIGVVKDFHLNSLKNPILPMYFMWTDIKYQMIANISSSDMENTLEFVRTEVHKIIGKDPGLEFLDDAFNRQYGSDDNFAELVGYFTMLAILIALMGLFGVATHTIKLRLKEIGIRKTLGASSWDILKMIFLYFLKILLVSIMIALPISWFAMENWLDNYPYRIDVSISVFIIGCVLTIFIAMLTILWKSWQASNLNPVKLIKHE